MKITVSGSPGSGKSTISKLLAKKLKLKRYYIGGMRREIARKHKMTLEELNKLGETEAWTDKEVDDYQEELGKKEDNFVIEGRTSFFLIPDSIKLYVKCDLKEAAKRIWKDLERNPEKRNEAKVDSEKGVLESIKTRMASDTKRYLKYYGKDPYNESQFDLVIDTTSISAEEAFEKVLEFVQSFK